jgi:hypothetical protein
MLGLMLALGAGCGGGGGSAPAQSGEKPIVGQQAFLLDFVNNTVTVIDEAGGVAPQLVERNPGAVTAELLLTLRIDPEGIPGQPGNVGRRHIFAKVTNRSSGMVGGTDSGGASVIELNFTSTRFQNAAAATVAGGGYAREDAFDVPSGTPIYYLTGGLAAGASSGEKQVDMWLPPGAVTAVVTAILRAHTQRFNPVSLNRFWVSTLAGEQGHYGFVNGVAWAALFGTHATFQGLLFRETAVDVLVAEPTYNVVRQLTGNSVTGKPEVFTAVGSGDAADLAQPMDLAEDALHNCYVSENGGACISMFTPNPFSTYKPIYVIAGSKGVPGDLPAAGAIATGATARFSQPVGLGMGYDALYVCDQNGAKLKKISATVPSSMVASNYRVEVVPTVGITRASDIAVDKLENKYIADAGSRKIFMCERRRTTWNLIAGTGVQGTADGPGNAATFHTLGPIVVDTGGILWVVDNGRLRRIRPVAANQTLATSWQVETIPLVAASSADGPAGVAGRRAVRGVAVSRGGVVGFMDDGALRRIDMTRD